MKLTQKQQKNQQFLSSIYAKAWEDKSFKQELIENPIETLNKFTGKIAKFPKNKRLVVVDQKDANSIYLNIPAKPNYESVDLTDEQLEAVAGGEILVLGAIGAGLLWAGLEHNGVIDTVDWL